MARYEIWLTDDDGMRIENLNSFLWLNATRTVNAIGSLQMGLPASFDTRLLRPDRIIQVWRAPTGGRLSLWRPYFLRRWEFSNVGGQDTITVLGPDCNDLLRRRIVAAYASSAQADKAALEADDMMKEIVTEAIADGVAPTPSAGTRVWADLSIAADLTAGPQLTKGFSFKPLLLHSGAGVLPGIAKSAREAGTEVFFDIVPDTVTSSAITFQFRTYTGQPGKDVSDSVVFSLGRGNLENPRLVYDYTSEENYIYGLGQDTESSREVQQAYDADRYNASKWARCEGSADARAQAAANGVREAARAALEEGRPKRLFFGDLMDTKGTRFGRDWEFGYRVKVQYHGVEFDAIVRAVLLSVNHSGRETVRAKAEYES